MANPHEPAGGVAARFRRKRRSAPDDHYLASTPRGKQASRSEAIDLEASCEGFWPRKRAHARVEDRIRHAKDCGIGRFPSREYAINTAWALAASIAADLIAWLRLLALPTALATCEPKALRHRFLHVPARLTHGSRRRHLRFPATWPWATDLVAAFTAIRALTPLRT